MRLAVFAPDLRRIVGRAIVHHENLRVPSFLLRISEKLIERRPDAAAFVIGGNDEAIGQKGPRTWCILRTKGCAEGLRGRCVRATLPVKTTPPGGACRPGRKTPTPTRRPRCRCVPRAPSKPR